MRPLKPLFLAGAVVATSLVGGTLISAAMARGTGTATPANASASPASDTGAYCKTFLDAFAAKLGVTTSEVTAAAKTAANAAIDAAVTAGDLTADQAARARDRIAGATGEGCGLLGHVGLFERDAPIGGLVEAAAGALKLSPAELAAKLRSGDSLKDVAAATGADYAAVSAAVTAALDRALADAVSAGRLTQDRADAIRAHIAGEISAGTWPDHMGRPSDRGPRGAGPGG